MEKRGQNIKIKIVSRNGAKEGAEENDRLRENDETPGQQCDETQVRHGNTSEKPIYRMKGKRASNGDTVWLVNGIVPSMLVPKSE